MHNTKKLLAALIAALLVLTLVPVSALAAANSTVTIRAALINVPFKSGITKINGYSCSTSSGNLVIDLGKYNVNNKSFKLPKAEDIFQMDGVKCTYVLTNSGQRQPGSSFSLFNGGNICSYYFERAATSYSITYNKNCNDTVSNMPSAQSGSTTASSITLSGNRPTRSGYEFQGWSTSSGSTAAQYQPGGSYSLSNGTSRTLYAVWKQTQKYQLTVETLVDNCLLYTSPSPRD